MNAIVEELFELEVAKINTDYSLTKLFWKTYYNSDYDRIETAAKDLQGTNLEEYHYDAIKELLVEYMTQNREFDFDIGMAETFLDWIAVNYDDITGVNFAKYLVEMFGKGYVSIIDEETGKEINFFPIKSMLQEFFDTTIGGHYPSEEEFAEYYVNEYLNLPIDDLVYASIDWEDVWRRQLRHDMYELNGYYFHNI